MAGHETMIRYYDEDDAELARLEREYLPLQAATLVRGTPEWTKREEMWARICDLRRTQNVRDNYRASH